MNRVVKIKIVHLRHNYVWGVVSVFGIQKEEILSFGIQKGEIL